ncbi:MAG: hypothetical protein NTW19_14730 [Planctomycetota bacterium]|nr:hypothetical protein [Planctomycetota bacterium]
MDFFFGYLLGSTGADTALVRLLERIISPAAALVIIGGILGISTAAVFWFRSDPRPTNGPLLFLAWTGGGLLLGVVAAVIRRAYLGGRSRKRGLDFR